jgi:hypothetical protein
MVTSLGSSAWTRGGFRRLQDHKQIKGCRKGENAEDAAGGRDGRRDERLDGLTGSTHFVQLFVFRFLEAFDLIC